MEEQLKTKSQRLGNTALHIAAYENNIEIVDKIILLESACSSSKIFKELLGIQNRNKDTAVHVAAARGCLKYSCKLHAISVFIFQNSCIQIILRGIDLFREIIFLSIERITNISVSKLEACAIVYMSNLEYPMRNIYMCRIMCT